MQICSAQKFCEMAKSVPTPGYVFVSHHYRLHHYRLHHSPVEHDFRLEGLGRSAAALAALPVPGHVQRQRLVVVKRPLTSLQVASIEVIISE